MSSRVEALQGQGQSWLDASASPAFALQPEWDDDDLRRALPLPAPDAHKYSRGALTVVAGSPSYPGAACLAALAGQRMGAGYTKVVTCAAARAALLARAPSLVVAERGDWHPLELAELTCRGPAAVCVGPGFVANAADDVRAVLEVLSHAVCPVLVDGGGLAALSEDVGRHALAARAARGRATVITPHGGEAARLAAAFGLEAGDPASLACALSAATGAIVVCKGPDTFVAEGARVVPMREGTPVLAKAGTGDVLAGMIAGLLAQGVAPFDAAVLGTTIHARAGAAAERAQTVVAANPEDVLDAIPEALRVVLKR